MNIRCQNCVFGTNWTIICDIIITINSVIIRLCVLLVRYLTERVVVGVSDCSVLLRAVSCSSEVVKVNRIKKQNSTATSLLC